MGLKTWLESLSLSLRCVRFGLHCWLPWVGSCGAAPGVSILQSFLVEWSGVLFWSSTWRIVFWEPGAGRGLGQERALSIQLTLPVANQIRGLLLMHSSPPPRPHAQASVERFSFALSRENKLLGSCHGEGGTFAFWCGAGEGIWNFNHFWNYSYSYSILTLGPSPFLPVPEVPSVVSAQAHCRLCGVNQAGSVCSAAGLWVSFL